MHTHLMHGATVLLRDCMVPATWQKTTQNCYCMTVCGLGLGEGGLPLMLLWLTCMCYCAPGGCW